jgi:hypothetical protein
VDVPYRPILLELARVRRRGDRELARGNQTWRRLSVTFPPHLGSHSTHQTFYFDAEGVLRRHDYNVEVAGNSPAAHYVSEYQHVSGFLIATKRRVFPRQPDNTPLRDITTIAIDLDHIHFA